MSNKNVAPQEQTGELMRAPELDPKPLLDLLGRTGPIPHTASDWCALALDAKRVQQTGLAGSTKGDCDDAASGSRLFGPLFQESLLDPYVWATLAAIDLGELHALGASQMPTLCHLPSHGWLHIALPIQSAANGHGDIDVQWIAQSATPSNIANPGFGWTDTDVAAHGQRLHWTPVTTPKPPSWIGFEHARTAIWALSLDADGQDVEIDEFFSKIEDENAPVFEATLGLDAHWTQETPLATNARMRELSPLLALHSSQWLHLGDAGTLGVHAAPYPDAPCHWKAAWALDSF